MDQKLDRVALDLLIPPINLPFELAARQDGARPRQERLQQGELARRELRCLAEVRGFPGCRIEAELSIGQQRRRARALAAQHSAHPCQQFANFEGLDQIIVGAEIEPIDPVVDAIPRGHDDDGKPAAKRAQVPQHVPAIGHRQAEIEQRQLVGFVFGCMDRSRAIRHPIDRIGRILERLLDGRADHPVVLDQQNAHPRFPSRRRRWAGLVVSLLT